MSARASLPAAQSGHFAVLDVLRAVAASAVFAHHLFQQSAPGDGNAQVRALMEHLGAWGVAIFFVLSGFCIHWSTLVQRERGQAFEWRDYARRRAWRIYPAFLCCLLLSHWAGQVMGSNLIHPSTWSDVAAHALLLSNVMPEQRDAVNQVLWSVVLEAHFYIAYGLMPKAFASQRATVRTTLFATVLGMLAFVGSVVLFPQGLGRVTFQHTALASGWTWCLGACVAEWVFAHGRKPHVPEAAQPGWLAVWRWPVVLLALLASFGMALMPAGIALQLQRFVLPLLCATVLWGALQIRWPFERLKPLMTLGLISYSLYLFHPLAIWAGQRWLSDDMASLVATVLMGVGLAYVGYRCVEVPGVRLGKRLG